MSKPLLNHVKLLSTADAASLTKVTTSSSILRQALNDTRSAKISLTNVRKAMIVTRPNFNLEGLTLEVANFLCERGVKTWIGATIPTEGVKYPNLISHWNADICYSKGHEIDLIVTLGGDGTVLFTSSLFQDKVPPVVPFHLGSLGFLTVFSENKYETVLQDILDGKPQFVNLRMRLQADIYQKSINDVGLTGVDSGDLGELMFSRKVLNEVVVDRGVHSTMVNLDLFGGNDYLTSVLADGLVISTPTGSTAYNLSAGGPLVHPSKSSVIVTPICPHTLTARPMILPSSLELKLSISPFARSTAWVSFDGRDRYEINEGGCIVIRTAVSAPFPTICGEDVSKDWFQSLVSSLGWNVRQPQKKSRSVPAKL